MLARGPSSSGAAPDDKTAVSWWIFVSSGAADDNHLFGLPSGVLISRPGYVLLPVCTPKRRCIHIVHGRSHVMAPPRRLRRQNPKIGEDCEFQRTDIFRHFIRLAGRFSEIWQSIKKISKNRSYTLKILEFHVESPEGN